LNSNEKLSTEDIIKELKELSPSNDEYKKILEEFNNLDRKKKEEVSEYINNELKPLLNSLKDNVDSNSIRSKLENKILNLETKINDLAENKEDHYNNSEAVKAHTQSALLKELSKNKFPEPPVSKDSSIPVPPSIPDITS
jgi:DNA-binding transcriptional MerR regulator